MRYGMIAAAAAMLIGAAPEMVKLPGWMAGQWVEETEAGWTEESWLPPRAGMMIGVSRSGKGETLQIWELARIAPDEAGRLTFWASPKGRAPSPFPLVSASATEIVFANPAHDYPQRIRYWREGADLLAEISLADGSKPMRWHYRRP